MFLLGFMFVLFCLLCRRTNLAQLTIDHSAELPVPLREKIAVCPIFDNLAAVQKYDTVGLGDRGESMGDENDRDLRIVEEGV